MGGADWRLGFGPTSALSAILIFHLFKGVFFLYFSSLSRAQLE